MTGTKIYRRGTDSRFTISLTPDDRAKLDEIERTYGTKRGGSSPISHSIAIALALDALHEEMQRGKLRTLTARIV
jgi:hypothetical protein